MNDPELQALRGRIARRFMLFGSQRRGRAAERLARLGTAAAARALAEAFITSADRRVTEIARQALTGLPDQTARDEVCSVVIATGDERLAALLVQAGHLPSDPGHRAVVLFLAGEFQHCAELDFDGSMLRAAHQVANENLRQQLAAKARAAGRVEWVRSVAGGQRRRLAELSDGEWETVIGVLVAATRWTELWRLAVQALAVWAARMLCALREQDWQPATEADRGGFAELTTLAVRCSQILAEHTPGRVTVLRGHRQHKRVLCLAVTPDGELLASGHLGHRALDDRSSCQLDTF